MNWAKNFLIFSLFVLGISIIYFIVTSYRLPHLVEQEVGLAPHEEEANEMSYIYNRYVFSENTDQSNQENSPFENEDNAGTTSDVSVDSIPDSLIDNFALEQASEDIADAFSEAKLKAERYAKLAQILPVVEELKDQKFKLTKQNEEYIEEHYRRIRLEGGPYTEPDPAVEEEYQDAVKIIDQKVSNYNRQIDNMFPELDITYGEQGIDYIFVFRKDQILREYFGTKLPFDGNPDYFSSD